MRSTTEVKTDTGIFVNVRVIGTEEAFEQIKPEWDDLVALLDPVPLPLTHNWLLSWWRAFALDWQMEFRCAYRGGELVGVAPFYRTRELFRGVPVTILRLAANGHTPYSGVLVNPRLTDSEKEVAFSALTRIDNEQIGQFLKINSEGELFRFLLAQPISDKWKVGVKPSLITPVIWINQEWDDFFDSRTRKFKKSLKHKLNRFNREPGFTITEEKITSSKQLIIEELIEISANSWKSSLGNDLKAHHRSRQFFFNLIDSFGQSGLLSAWIVRHKERPVAFELHLAYDGIIYPIRADYDEAYKSFSPGSVLEYSILKHLFQAGRVRQYYTCADNYWYLNNWTSDHEEFRTVEVFGDSVKSRWLYVLEYRFIPLAKRIIGKAGNSSGRTRR